MLVFTLLSTPAYYDLDQRADPAANLSFKRNTSRLTGLTGDPQVRCSNILHPALFHMHNTNDRDRSTQK